VCANNRCAGRSFRYPTGDRWFLPVFVPDPRRRFLPGQTRGYTRTRSLPVRLPLLGIIGLWLDEERCQCIWLDFDFECRHVNLHRRLGGYFDFNRYMYMQNIGISKLFQPSSTSDRNNFILSGGNLREIISKLFQLTNIFQHGAEIFFK